MKFLWANNIIYLLLYPEQLHEPVNNEVFKKETSFDLELGRKLSLPRAHVCAHKFLLNLV